MGNKRLGFSLGFRCLCFVLTLLCCHSASAVETYTPELSDPLAEPWRWRSFPELQDQVVSCVAEGADGAIWFGAEKGVLRYDGMRWMQYNEKNGFVSRRVRALGRDHDGVLYAASGRSFWRFKENAWEKLPVDYEVFRISPSATGVWLATASGAIHFDGHKLVFYTTKNAGAPLRRAFPDRNVSIQFFPNLTEDKKFYISDILETSDGQVWLAVRDHLLIRFDPAKPLSDRSSWKVYKNGERGLYFRARTRLRLGMGGSVWISSNGGLRRFNENTEVWDSIKLPNQNDKFREPTELLQCRDGTWLVCAVSSIYSHMNKKWNRIALPSPEFSDPILLEASDRSLWIGKEQGKFFRVDRSSTRWRSYKGLNFQCVDQQGTEWFLTREGEAVSHENRTWKKYTVDDGLISIPVRIICTQEGQLWVVGSDHTVAATACFHAGRWRKKRHPLISERMNHQAFAELSDGRLLFGCAQPIDEKFKGGVVCVKQAGGDSPVYSYLLPPDYPVFYDSIVEYEPGKIVFGGNSFQALGKVGGAAEFLKGLPTKRTNLITKDHQGLLWVATTDATGLHRFDGENWLHFSKSDGLGGSRISAVACTKKDGTVWAAMSDGISRYDGKQWTSEVLGEDFPGFAVKYGALHALDNGALWVNYADANWYGRRAKTMVDWNDEQMPFATIRFRPDKDAPDTEFITMSREVSPPGNVYFEWSGHSPWENTPRDELYFSWRLNGGEWSPFAQKFSHYFLALAPGKYRLEVRSRDQGFNVDPSPAMTEFTVLAPIWRQAWFWAMIIFFSGGLVTLAYFLIRGRQQHLIEIEQIKLRFFTSISHELRTPLTVLIGPLHSLYETTTDAKTKALLEMMIRNAEKLRKLVDQILDIRKLESGRMPIDEVCEDVVQFVRTLAESLEPLAQDKEIDFQIELPRTTCFARFDLDKFQKILGNLISNAVKYTPEGGTVRVRAEIAYAEGTEPESITIKIEDSGIGIAEKDQELIFARYYRAESGPGGTGLGLALVKELLDLLGGSVCVESPILDSGGTRFVITLPLKKALEEELENLPADEKMDVAGDQRSSGEGATLLVVDDNADIRAFILSELGDRYRILEAENGAVGLERAREILPDLIITDVMMPVMDGIQFCQEIKTDELLRHIPVLMLTARSSQQHEIEGREYGADDYVTKPFSIPLLKVRILTLLEARRVMREHYSKQIEVQALDIKVESADQQFMERLIKAIEKHMADWDFGVDQLAEAMGISARALRYKMKAVSDHTPSALIRLIRLKQAKVLLETRGAEFTVSEVADAVGFSDVSHFGKLFKKQFGMAPSALLPEKQ